MIGEDFRAKS